MTSRVAVPVLVAALLGSAGSVAAVQGDGDLAIRLADVCGRVVTGRQRVQALEARAGPSTEVRQLGRFYGLLADYCERHGIDVDEGDAEGDG